MVIVFIRIVHASLYGASKTGNPLTMWGDILQTHLVQNAPDIFRIKQSSSRRRHNFQSSEHFLLSFYRFSDNYKYHPSH